LLLTLQVAGRKRSEVERSRAHSRETSMLKITRALSQHVTTLQLDGRITGRWVELLRESAESVLDEGMELSIDLKNICFIDCEGIAVLKNLIGRGAAPTNAPLFVLEQIRKCKDDQS